MIFIFDIGNVLVDYKPQQFLSRIFDDTAVAEKMMTTIFASPEWLLMDAGKLSHAEAMAIFCAKEPQFREAIQYTMQRIPEMLTPIMETVNLLPEIVAAGSTLYYLSNYHSELRDLIMAKYRFFDLFSGGVFSCDVQMLKPEPGIYHTLLAKYGLESGDCLFFDDMPANVEAAQKEGIRGILFTGADSVREFM